MALDVKFLNFLRYKKCQNQNTLFKSKKLKLADKDGSSPHGLITNGPMNFKHMQHDANKQMLEHPNKPNMANIVIMWKVNITYSVNDFYIMFHNFKYNTQITFFSRWNNS